MNPEEAAIIKIRRIPPGILDPEPKDGRNSIRPLGSRPVRTNKDIHS